MQEMGTTMPILFPICPAPLPSGLRLVIGGLGWRDREGVEERETEKRGRDEAGARRGKANSEFKLLPTKPIYIPNNEEHPPTV